MVEHPIVFTDNMVETRLGGCTKADAMAKLRNSNVWASFLEPVCKAVNKWDSAVATLKEEDVALLHMAMGQVDDIAKKAELRGIADAAVARMANLEDSNTRMADLQAKHDAEATRSDFVCVKPKTRPLRPCPTTRP